MTEWKNKRQYRLDALLQRITDIAVTGGRCPVGKDISSSDLRMLAFAGKIKLEVVPRNWRVVTILQGEFAGMHTRLSPIRGEAYLVIDTKGTHHLGKAGAAASRRGLAGPSTPRLLKALRDAEG